MKTAICPFCGVVSDARHETQQACIDALQNEIVHTRDILERLSERPAPSVAERPAAGQDPQLT